MTVLRIGMVIILSDPRMQGRQVACHIDASERDYDGSYNLYISPFGSERTVMVRQDSLPPFEVV